MADGSPEERFFAVVSSILNVRRELLGPESSQTTVEEWDSIKHMHVVLALEEEFNIEFTDDEIAKCSSASGLMKAIAGKTGVAFQ